MIEHLEVLVNNLEFYQTADKNVAPIHPDVTLDIVFLGWKSVDLYRERMSCTQKWSLGYISEEQAL